MSVILNLWKSLALVAIGALFSVMALLFIYPQVSDPGGSLLAISEGQRCTYQTIAEGDFLVEWQISSRVLSCNSTGDKNYDPYVAGSVYGLAPSGLTVSFDYCSPVNSTAASFSEFSCDGPTLYRTTRGICTACNENRTACLAGSNTTISREYIDQVYSCNFFGDNFDLFSAGYVEFQTLPPVSYSNQERCLNTPPVNFVEFSCSTDGKTLVETYGNCTKGCNNGACIKTSRQVKVCGLVEG